MFRKPTSQARLQSRRGRKRRARSEPFGDTLRALARTRELPAHRQRGAIARVIRAWVGGCPVGRYWADDILAALSGFRLRDSVRTGGAIRRSAEPERKLAEFLIRRIAGMRRAKDGSIRAIDRDVVWQGRTRAAVLETDEIERALENAGLGAEQQCMGYCPARSQGGFASRMQRSVRQCARYAQAWRDAGLLESEQPPIDAEDAIAPRKGDWSYAQWWPARRLPSAVLRGLRLAWGEVSDLPEQGAPTRARASSESKRPLPPPVAAAPPFDRESLAREAARIARMLAN